MPDKPQAPREKDEDDAALTAPPRKHYTLRPTITPVSLGRADDSPKGAACPTDAAASSTSPRGGEALTCEKPVVDTGHAVSTDPFIRSANEDDDGYDPYSDRREEPPLFESDPWD